MHSLGTTKNEHLWPNVLAVKKRVPVLKFSSKTVAAVAIKIQFKVETFDSLASYNFQKFCPNKFKFSEKTFRVYPLIGHSFLIWVIFDLS